MVCGREGSMKECSILLRVKPVRSTELRGYKRAQVDKVFDTSLTSGITNLFSLKDNPHLLLNGCLSVLMP